MPGRGDASTKDTVTALTTNIERKRPGRPPGTSDTRERILKSARNLFARNGIDKTSIRAVAADAGVDPALVHHYFGTKTQLFAAAIHIPIDPIAVIGPLREVPVERIGYVLPSVLHYGFGGGRPMGEMRVGGARIVPTLLAQVGGAGFGVVGVEQAQLRDSLSCPARSAGAA